MKHLLIVAVCFLSMTFVSCDANCGPDASWDSIYNTCKFHCTSDGVVIDCTKPGCRCFNFEQYFNTDINTCLEVNCENKNCAGLQNEAFFTCESSSRDICGCDEGTLDDCRQGCMCKDGFCRQNGVCVPRNCN